MEATDGFPPGFFDRADPSDDALFYAPTRLVTHIDDRAIAAVTALYRELGVGGRVLDLMSSWVSHLDPVPDHLTVLGMNEAELAANPVASERVVQDLNREPQLPLADESHDAVLCCVSVDYLIRPVEVFDEVHRVLKPGGAFVCTFSNRCFPTKVIRAWLALDEPGRVNLVREYFARTGPWSSVESRTCLTGIGGDPLYAVWGRR